MMTSSLLSYFQDTKWRHRTNTNLKKLVGKFGTEWAPKIISFRWVLCPDVQRSGGLVSSVINIKKFSIIALALRVSWSILVNISLLLNVNAFQVEGTRSELIPFLTDTIYAGPDRAARHLHPPLGRRGEIIHFILTPEYISDCKCHRITSILHSLQSMTWFNHLNNVPRSKSAAAKSESGQGQVSKSQSEIKLWKPKYEVEDLD